MLVPNKSYSKNVIVMTRKRITLILTMLVLAVFAIGAVSAADDIATDIEEPTDDIAIDDIAVDDDSVDETVDIQETEQIRDTTYDVDENSDIQDVINTSEVTTHVVNFKPIQYNLTDALKIHGNVTLYGNGATLLGIGNNNIFDIAGASNFTITGFKIITNSTSKTAFYGANVFNAEITNNNITGGKDGINIMQTHDNITITGNRITNVTRDAISLVDHRNLNDTEWAERGYSTISNNIITGNCEFGMFFGGNFKGTIEDNVINGADCAIQFAGKKAATNGRLYADIIANDISNVQMGIDVNHPGIDSLFIALNDIVTLSNTTNFAINYGSYLAKLSGGQIWVYNNYLYGLINQTFINICDDFDDNYGYVVV